MEATATKPEEKKARKPRAAGEYLLQKQADGGGWQEATKQTFTDTAEAKKYVRDGGTSEGKFRVLQVCATFAAQRQTKTVTRLS